MKNSEIIREILNYIDENIDAQLSAKQLAEKSGYSFYYFCHLFTEYTGTSVATYIRKRRLQLAGLDMLKGSSATEAALRRGFETPSGFAKAFRREFGVSPTEYRDLEGIILKPEIVSFNAFRAIGYDMLPPEGEFEVGDVAAYWQGQDFSLVPPEVYAELTYDGFAEIGAWISPDEISGEFHYFFGPVVQEDTAVPENMTAIEIPASKYAVFRIPEADGAKALCLNIRKAWNAVFTEWLDDSGFRLGTDKQAFEFYKGNDTFIYIPIQE